MITGLASGSAGQALEWDASLGAFKFDDRVQDDRGKEADDPFQPMISFGTKFDTGFASWVGWDTLSSLTFAPRLGYARNLQPSRDSYGEQKSETLFWHYDFLYALNETLQLRLGWGSVWKRVSGDGGAVTVPNGGSTATAYRPSGTKSSATASLNLGLDYAWSLPSISSSPTRCGFEVLALQPLDSKRRWFGYQFTFGVYL